MISYQIYINLKKSVKISIGKLGIIHFCKELFIYTGSVYYNNENQHYENPDITNGFLSLHDLNVNRTEHSSSGDYQIIKPFVTKQGSFYNIKT